MKRRHERFLKELLETPSPTGSEELVAALVRKRLSDVADEIQTNTMGSVHAVLEGNGEGPTLMLAAHMDEIGLMVRYVSDDGFYPWPPSAASTRHPSGYARRRPHVFGNVSRRGRQKAHPPHRIGGEEKRHALLARHRSRHAREGGARDRPRGRRHHLRGRLRAFRAGHGGISRLRRQVRRVGSLPGDGEAGFARSCKRRSSPPPPCRRRSEREAR